MWGGKRTLEELLMPVNSESIMEAKNKILIPYLISFGTAISFCFFVNWITKSSYIEFVILAIYIISIVFGSWIIYINETEFFPKLMEIEKNAYYKAFGEENFKEIREGNSGAKNYNMAIDLNKLENRPFDFIKTQYDYYIRKTLLTQQLGSYYLITLMSGIVLDIALNSLEPYDAFRTVILVGSISIFSLIFLVVALLKHAEYNAGCAVYRNAILGVTAIHNNYDNGAEVKKSDLATVIGNILKELRLKCDKSAKEKEEEFWIDGWRTICLLELLLYIQKK